MENWDTKRKEEMTRKIDKSKAQNKRAGKETNEMKWTTVRLINRGCREPLYRDENHSFEKAVHEP